MDVSSFQKEIDDYKKKIQQLRERQRIEAAKARREEARQKKREDDRRKVLYGVGILEALRHGRITQAKVFELINQSITRPQDRVFLGLPEGPQKTEGEESQATRVESPHNSQHAEVGR